MARYKYGNRLVHSEDTTFDAVYKPGALTPLHGIYRCEGCGKEILSSAHDLFPPQDHHTHTERQGAVRWRLIVVAQ
jgi:hypothetical protein